MSTEAWRRLHYGPPCRPRLRRVPFGNITLWVHEPIQEAATALGAILQKHRYHIRATDTGCYNCRRVADSRTWSGHSWAIEIDVNWNTNPYGRPLRTDYPPAAITEIEALRTNSGHRVWAWGGRWGTPDAMHFGIAATPAQLATGIRQTKDWFDMATKEELRQVVREEIENYRKGQGSVITARLQLAVDRTAAIIRNTRKIGSSVGAQDLE